MKTNLISLGSRPFILSTRGDGSKCSVQLVRSSMSTYSNRRNHRHPIANVDSDIVQRLTQILSRNRQTKSKLGLAAVCTRHKTGGIYFRDPSIAPSAPPHQPDRSALSLIKGVDAAGPPSIFLVFSALLTRHSMATGRVSMLAHQ